MSFGINIYALLLSIHLGEEFLDCSTCLCLVYTNPTRRFVKETIPIILPSAVNEITVHILSTWYCQSFEILLYFNHSAGVYWYYTGAWFVFSLMCSLSSEVSDQVFCPFSLGFSFSYYLLT